VNALCSPLEKILRTDSMCTFGSFVGSAAASGKVEADDNAPRQANHKAIRSMLNFLMAGSVNLLASRRSRLASCHFKTQCERLVAFLRGGYRE
jgi:hypothetical protein